MSQKKENKPNVNQDKVSEKKLATILSVNLKALRKARGWSQAELATLTNVHLTHISRVELGMYLPNAEFLLLAAKAFGVTIEDLFTDNYQGFVDISTRDLEMNERLKMLERLDQKERDAIITVIDSILTKHRIKQLLDDKQLVS